MRETIDEKKLRDRIVMIRKQAGKNQSDVARELNVSRQAISFMEKNCTSVSVVRLAKYAQVLGCNIADFFVGL